MARAKGTDILDNGGIAEVLAIEGDAAKPPLQKAFRRAARRAFLWPVEAAQLLRERRPLMELAGIGPYLEKIIRRWIEDPPPAPTPPAIRNGFLTTTQAQKALAKKRAWLGDLKGDLQMHSEWSDGSASVKEMAEVGEERGYEYIAITDHAKGLKIAGGVDEKQLSEQGDEISAVNDGMKRAGKRIRVLRSIELNLSPRGEGDMEPRALGNLDVVLGCFHSSLRKKEDQTARYLAALRNPSIHILGHPRGRIYNFRLGLTAEWPRVFDLAAKLDKAVEIDCYPDRQDLNMKLVRLAKKSGCRISLGTDSHGPSQLRFIELGLASAMLAGVPQERILNFMGREELVEWASRCRKS